MDETRKNARPWWILGGLSIALLAGSVLLGRYPAPVLTPLSTLAEDDLARSLVFHVRLPRILAAFLLGASLSAAGAVFQTVFRNPLVDSGFLGVSQGAAFGASLAIVALGSNPWMIQGAAAVFALLGLALSYAVARRVRMGEEVLRLVLSGICVGAFYAAGTGILKYVADPARALPDITYWMLGGIWGMTWKDLAEFFPAAAAGLAVIFFWRGRLNLLSLRDETAFSLGAAPGRERLILLLAAVLATAAGTAKAGQIAWVGLIVPHIARRIVGTSAWTLVPGSMLIGGLFVLACDDLSRTALSGEIPLGILTSLIGTVVFLFLLVRKKVGGLRD